MTESLAEAIARRRTFAIIAHPDAGKTTLTEKLLLFGGAIQMAGMVKARGEQRRARSDWMKVERERGISVTASVMTFDYAGCTFNLLDTPGHEDFSEDTYRTLTAVDSAVMVLDAAKGIEEQTRKLFEVCRLRDVPIITFVNKMDREGREPLDLMDEIEKTLALEVTPASWPIGMGQDFLGCYDLRGDRLVLVPRKGDAAAVARAETVSGLEDPKLDALLPPAAAARLREEVAMVRELCPPFDLDAYRSGTMTPVFFGSAVNNFGVKELIDGLAAIAPPPRPQPAVTRRVDPDEPTLSGFVFKIQANMDPKHRDRVAFMRLCSGRFRRGMRLTHARSGKQLALHNAMLFMAQEREIAEEAYAGDIIGIPNHGSLRIGDVLSEGEALTFTGIPSFAPEHLQRVRAEDPMKAKHLERALVQIAEEGGARVFKPRLGGTGWIVGVVGPLQFDVLAARIRSEFDVPVKFEPTALHTARWIEGDPRAVKEFLDGNRGDTAEDHDGAPVFLARNAWHLDRAAQDWPALTFLKTKEQLH
ncbi:MAG: peptide chain release factor 3 [Thalassobaculales bacterium]